MGRIRNGRCLVLAACLSLLATRASAESSGREGEVRVLKEHTLQFPTLVQTPLVATTLGLTTGTQFDTVPDLPFGPLGTLTLDQLRFAEGVDFGVQVAPRVGIFANVIGTAFAGTSPKSLVIRGGEYDIEGNGGAIVELYRNNESGTLLSVRGGAGGGGGRVFAFLPLLSSLSQAPGLTAIDLLNGNAQQLLVTPFSTFRWNASLAFAQALARAFSIQASAGFQHDSTTFKPFDVVANVRGSTQVTTDRPQFAIALGGDAIQLHVPVAVLLEYRITPLSRKVGDAASRSRTEQDAALGVYYSGRAFVQAGVVGLAALGEEPVQGVSATGAPAESGKPRSLGALVTLRVIW